MKLFLKFISGLVLIAGTVLLVAKLALARPIAQEGVAPKGYPNREAIMGAIALKELKLIDMNPPLPPGVIETKNIEYGKIGDRTLQLDLFSPTNLVKPVPGLIFIHGGGWKGGKRQDYRVYTTHFASLGYVVATITYRLVPEAPFPACVQDSKNAVRWMRNQASRINVDPDRIAVIGGSAGGHLALMVGFSSKVKELEGAGGFSETSSEVSAVINFYGPVDLTTPFATNSGLVKALLSGKSFAEAPDLYRQASPITYLSASSPPTLTFHGTLDDIVPIDQADTLHDRMKKLGRIHEYERLEGWPHTMDASLPVNRYAKSKMEAFLATRIGKPGNK